MSNDLTRSGYPYTEEEDEVLNEYAHRPIQWLSKKLKRPQSGVKARMIHLGLYHLHETQGTFSANHLAQVIGVSYETIRRWILHKDLPAKKRARYNKVSERNKHYHITPEGFWGWAKEHKELVPFHLIEINSLPPEPAWVDAERRVKRKRRGVVKQWTTKEDKKLMHYYHEKGYTQKKTAELLGRPLSSTEKRISKLTKEMLS